MGPYRIEHVDIASVSVYTNNGMSGEFWGFGGNQAIFALEGQIDRLASQARHGCMGVSPPEYEKGFGSWSVWATDRPYQWS